VDVLLFTAVRVHHVIGLRFLCAWGLGRRFKRLCFFLLTSQAEYSEDFHTCHFPQQSKLIASVLRSIDRLGRSGEVIFAGDSHITCREYEKLAGVPMTLFPSPGEKLCLGSSGESAGGPTFTMLGVSSWDKGIDVFQAAIMQFLERNPASEARFVLQWGVTCEGPGGNLIPISERLRNEQRVTLLERRLSNEEYADLFAAATFIVLPYRRKTYFNRLSGVLVEAACSGKPMIVTEGTWLEWAMHEFGCGLSVPEGDSSKLCEAMYLCCAEVRKLTNEAKVRSSSALSYNSSERYLKLLWNELVYRDPELTSRVVP
jgi:glycosyltransferase involved in cell wall biosynthesis